MTTPKHPWKSMPFICGLCEVRYDGFEEFYLHLKTHDTRLTKCFHICGNSEVSNHNETLYKCDLCTCRFRSICSLHDHIKSCVDSGSYIFDHHEATAYPLSAFCSFYETRDEVTDEVLEQSVEEAVDDYREKEGKKESSASKHKYNGLRKLLLNVLNDRDHRDSVKAYCDSAADTSHIDMHEASNISARTRTKSASKISESKKNAESGITRRKLKTPAVKKPPETTEIDGDKTSKSVCRSKNSKNVDRKQTDDMIHNKQEDESLTDVKQKLKRKPKGLDTENVSADKTNVTNTVSKRKRGRPRKISNIDTQSREKENDFEADLWNEYAMHKISTSDINSDTTGLPSEEYLFLEVGAIKKVETSERNEFENVDTHSQTSSDYSRTDNITSESKATVLEKKLSKHDKNQTTNGSSKLRNLLSVKQESLNGVKDMSKRKTKTNSKKLTAKTKSKDGSTNVLLESKEKPTQKRGRKSIGLQTCEICGKAVKKCKMKVHVISHSDFRPFSCDRCPKTYKYQEHLVMHKKSHDDVLPFYCEVCGQGFIDANRLKRHSIMHTDDRPFTCSVCGAGFVTRYKLERHMFAHTGVKRMQCDLCGSRFAHKESLSQHILSIHKQERRFPCTECDKKFFTNYQLKCHTMKHKGIRPYKCNKCLADFIERKELRRHMRKIHKINNEGELIQDLTNTKESSNKKTAKRKTKNGANVSMLTPNQASYANMSHDQIPSSVVSHDQIPSSVVSHDQVLSSVVSHDQVTCPTVSHDHVSSADIIHGQISSVNILHDAVTSANVSHGQMTCISVSHGQAICTNVSQQVSSGSLPVFVSSLNQSGDTTCPKEGTSPVGSDQHQICQQSFQGQGNGDASGYLNVQPSTVNDLNFDSQSMRLYVGGEEQKDSQYGPTSLNNRDQRIFVPLYLTAQVKQQRGYDGFGAQMDSKGPMYDMLNAPEPKTGSVYGQVESAPSKDQLTYQSLQPHNQTQKNFTVL